jgi:hypothetical protein
VIDICRTLPTFEKTDLGHVRQQSVTWEKVNVLNGTFLQCIVEYVSTTTLQQQKTIQTGC